MVSFRPKVAAAYHVFFFLTILYYNEGNMRDK